MRIRTPRPTYDGVTSRRLMDRLRLAPMPTATPTSTTTAAAHGNPTAPTLGHVPAVQSGRFVKIGMYAPDAHHASPPAINPTSAAAATRTT